ncbi:MAG: tetratricopeptide repeat protein [Planctomycetota bacterium]|nr:tetratricopeptide repeat protein [Planctomycetota bacterium]
MEEASTTGSNLTGSAKVRRQRYVPVVGPRLRRLLAVILGAFALLSVNSVYLATISVLQWSTGAVYQNWFYLIMFLFHLVVGVLIVVPLIVYGAIHFHNARNRPNRRAIRAGYALFSTALVLLATGIVLTRIEGVIVVKDPTVRSIAYWVHVISPLLVVWLFILHRLAGRRIRWRVGLSWTAAAAVFALVMSVLHSQDPRQWNVAGPASGEQYFFPSLARTLTGNFIPERALMNDQYCIQCHRDIHESWSHSVHRFSSFNNPPYTATVLETRKAMFERDGNVQGSRFCAGCHDPVPFFSGAFDDPKFDDPNYDLASDPTAQAGITCSVCHSITHINTVRGNADYTIDEPVHYPFAYSDHAVLKWVNRQLVKAKPDFHKKVFLKPEVHRSTAFCGTCHKVHLPEELNAYKFLRGQNHYDSFWLSGVSGYGVSSFYYPPKAETNCNQCHMPLMVSDDFGARYRDDSGELKVHNHMFPSANTAMAVLVGMDKSDAVINAHRDFLEGVMRVDIFGLKDGATIDSPLIAPIRPEVPTLEPGREYLIETVIRTMKMGHLFTQGTADSNEVWLDVTVSSGNEIIGRSGGRRRADNAVDPWSHFVNAFVLDRDGNRINRRNAQDIFVALYNHQIPPGAGDAIHYLLRVPPTVTEPITVDLRLQYRKFDTEYMRFVTDDPDYFNDLPITTLATDQVTFPVAVVADQSYHDESPIVAWQRWNDYGIGLLRKGRIGELRQAEDAFKQVEALGRPDGPLNLARVYLKEGRVARDAPEALRRARDFDPPAYEWSVLWFTGLVNTQNGNLDEAIRNFQQIVEGGFEQARGRGFDFAKDYRLLNELGQTIYERARQERGRDRRARREQLLNDAMTQFQAALELDPENVAAHYNLSQIYAALGDDAEAAAHRKLHAKYKPDDNARDLAIAAARIRYPAANRAAEAVVIYDLRRPGAYDLPPESRKVARHD